MTTGKIKFKNLIAYMAIIFFIVFAIQAYAADVSYQIPTQNATQSWSSNSFINIDTSWSQSLKYVNKWDNSSIIGNYFSGLYYDTNLGFFKTDWSTNQAENVRIVGSSALCSTWYGYKLGWYAYSDDFGFVDFDYNSQIFVYYCENDSSLHGYSYSLNNWLQNFEGITFQIQTQASNPWSDPTGNNQFVNDSTTVTNDGDVNDPSSINSNFTPTSIQNDSFEFEAVNESLFYIIK